jgi:hypothetical protein
MKPFSGGTDVAHKNVVSPEARAYFSATGARLREQVWLRIETRWLADGTPVKVTIYREDLETGAREKMKTFDGKLSGDLWEQQWKIELPKERLDELHGDIHLSFDAALKGVDPVRSQLLLVHRTAFSS